MLTPPDWYTEHMAMRGARPMVVPWKDMPLQEARREGDLGGDWEAVPMCLGVGGHTRFPWPADFPRSFPRVEAVVTGPTGQLPAHHTSHFLSPTPSWLQRNTKRERKVVYPPQYTHNRFFGRKWAGFAKLHRIPAAQEKVRGRRWWKGGTDSDAEVNHAHFHQLPGSNALSLALWCESPGQGWGHRGSSCRADDASFPHTQRPRKQLCPIRSLTKCSWMQEWAVSAFVLQWDPHLPAASCIFPSWIHPSFSYSQGKGEEKKKTNSVSVHATNM